MRRGNGTGRQRQGGCRGRLGRTGRDRHREHTSRRDRQGNIEHRDGRVEEGEGTGWTGRGREGDLDNCTMGEMVEVGAQVTTAACENRTLP